MNKTLNIRNILIIFLLVSFFVFALALVRRAPRSTAENTRLLTDMIGNEIRVPDPLTRVALFGGPTGQIAYILGARDQLCAVTNTLKGSELLLAFDPTVTELPGPRSTSGHINIEELLLAEPQLVIAGNLDGSIVQKKTGIPVAFTESSMNHDTRLLKEEIRFYAMIFGKQERGEKYNAYLDKTLSFIRSRTSDIPQDQRKKVFNGYGPQHLVTLGGDTFMHERIETAGCLDATAAISTTGKQEGLHSGLSEMSMEKVLAWNPDILIIDTGTPEEIYNDPRWQNVTAIQNRQVFKQPVGIFIWDRPTAEAAVLYPLWLAKTAYPERFADVDLVAEVKRFYRETMDFDLSDDQSRSVLNGDYSFTFGAVAGKR
ncbi:MAG: ABC transporter substrate-binding protein [Syntrophotaleaceae bacterium]